MVPAAPTFIDTLVDRFDPSVFDARRPRTRIRLAVAGNGAWDAVVTNGVISIAVPDGEADALLTADVDTWQRIAADLRGGMDAYRASRLFLRRNLHVGVGFLAATNGATDPGRLRFHTVATRHARLSVMEAGVGPPILAIHGLGGTKGSFVPTVSIRSATALAGASRWRSGCVIRTASAASGCSRPRWRGGGGGHSCHCSV